LVEEWFTKNSHMEDQEILDVIIREKRDLLSSFNGIFSDPGLRLQWKKFSLEDIDPSSIGELLKKSYALNNLDKAINAIHNLDLPEESKRNAFEKVVANFQGSGLPEINSVDKFSIYASLFSATSRIDNR